MRRFASSDDKDFACIVVDGALGVNYIELAPVSAIAVSDGGSSDGGRSDGAILGG